MVSNNDDMMYVAEEDIIQCLPVGFTVDKILDQKQSTTGYETYKVQLSKFVWIRKDLIPNSQTLLDNFIQERLEKTFSEAIEIVHDDMETNKRKDVTRKVYPMRDRNKENANILPMSNDDGMKIRKRVKDIVCNVCKTIHLYDSDFEEHIRQIHDGINVNLQCHICQKLLKDKNALKAHLVIHSADSPFECKYCSKRFKLRKRVNEHIKTHHGTYECTVCYLSFEKLSEFKAHAAREHPSESPRLQSNFFPCVDCDSVFLNRSTLMTHMRSHAVQRSFQCSHCSKRFKSQKHLKAHLRRVCEKQVRLVCKVCGKLFRNESEHRMHLGTHDGTNPLYCSQCDKYFLKASLFAIHKATHTANKTKEKTRMSYHCSECDKVFLHKRNFLLHEHVHYGKNPYKCAICDHFFLKKSHLDKHNAWFHSRSARYSCKVCGKAFRLRNTLLKHELKHDAEKGNDRVFFCISCDLRFLSERDLTAHLRESMECFSADCHLCSKIFPSETQLQRHLSQQHNIFTSENIPDDSQEISQNACPICFRVFQRKSKLMVHIRSVHQKIKDFSCPTCGREFARKHDMKKHMEIHKRELPHGNLECRVCNQKGFNEESLKIHQFSHMRVENTAAHLNDNQLMIINKDLSEKSNNHFQVHESDLNENSENRETNLFAPLPGNATFDFSDIITPRQTEKSMANDNDCTILVQALRDQNNGEYQINAKEIAENLKLEFRENGHIITIAEVVANNDNVSVLTAYEDHTNTVDGLQNNQDETTQTVIYQPGANSHDQIEYLSQIAAQFNESQAAGFGENQVTEFSENPATYVQQPADYNPQIAIDDSTVEVFQIQDSRQMENVVETDVQGLVIATVPEENSVVRQQQEQYLQNVESLLLHATTLSNNN